MHSILDRRVKFAFGMIGAALCTTAFAAFVTPVPLKGQRTDSRAAARPTVEAGPSSPAELEKFADPVITSEMSKWHIPGAAFLVVKDGKVLYQKGYGFADLENQVRVDPGKTIFRVGSVSKLFTVTAVMQLVDRGQVDLHTDVNRYIQGFQLPGNFPEPVTLASLLTHTAGFDDEVIGIAARTPVEVIPLGEYLAHSMPPRARPPGAMYSYSSHGIALAGYIVQSVSRQLFADYIEKNILDPLEMWQSSFRPRSVPPEDMARGYVVHDGVDQPVPYDYFNIGPAVALDSTAGEMAHFMIANLDGGVYDGHRLLSERTLAEMQRRHFGEDPRVPGRAFGFYEKFRNGWRAIGHGGNIQGFGSLLLLIPKARTGIFLTANVDQPQFDDEIVAKFFDHYFPAQDDPEETPQAQHSMTEMRKYAGSYRINPYSGTSIEKMAMLNWQYRVVPLPDGTLEIHYPHDIMPPGHWVERGPSYFERTDGQGRAVFREDSSGRVTAMILDSEAHLRLSWFDTPSFQVRLVKTLLLIFLSMPLVWLLEYAVRGVFKRPAPSSKAVRFARLVALAAGASAIVFVVGFMRAVSHMDFWVFTYGMPPAVQHLLSIPPFTAAATCGMLVFDVRSWMKRDNSAFDRVYYTVLTFAAILFVWFLIFWNLLKIN